MAIHFDKTLLSLEMVNKVYCNCNFDDLHIFHLNIYTFIFILSIPIKMIDQNLLKMSHIISNSISVNLNKKKHWAQVIKYKW